MAAAVEEYPCLAEAMHYGALGWRVVPLHVAIDGRCSCGNEKCGNSRGKHPRLKKWQDKASADEDTICEWWNRWPESNVGVQLGPSSGIVDFETDSDEGERLLAEWFGGVIPPTPCFSSGKGKHRLFRWRNDFPSQANVPMGWGDLKLGSNDAGSQSVFPPSRHYSGKAYRWLIHPDDIPPAAISDAVFARIWNREEDTGPARKPIEHWEKISEGTSEGGRNAAVASLVGSLLFHLATIDDTHALQTAYQFAIGINQNNKPPLDDAELKAIFESILRKERQRRATEAADAVLSRTPEQRIAEATKTGLKTPENMHLVIVQSDPKIYELYAPQFHKSRDGCLRLTVNQLCSVPQLKVQAVEQASVHLDKSFGKAYMAKGGLLEQLLYSAEERQAAAVEKRLATAAEYLIGRLVSATPRPDGKDEPDTRKPIKMTDGSVWFRWAETWKDGIFDQVVQREDIRRLANCLGLTDRDFELWPKKGENRRRFCRFEKKRIDALFKLAEIGSDGANENTVLEGK